MPATIKVQDQQPMAVDMIKQDENSNQQPECQMDVERDPFDSRGSDSPTSDSSDMSSQSVNSPTATPKHVPPQKTVIIFDWDDTLLASSYLSSRGYRLDSHPQSFTEDVLTHLGQLEKTVIAVIELALMYGDVHVITNAETGWVQMSAEKFLPSVVPYLEKVTVLSARSTYEGMYPDAPFKWKYHAFNQRLEAAWQFDGVRNIISFGDSHVEREAVRTVTRGRDNTITKSVKFAERPSIEQLRRQIELITNCFDYIHNREEDLDLMLSISMMC